MIAGALVALAACNEAAAPKGTPGDLKVRAYVDRDASGTFTSADSALAGVEINVVDPQGPDGSSARTATTDASGLATFDDLPPGSYVVGIGSGAPTGAVLTTNPTPTIGVSAQGTITGNADFRFSFYPGSVSGQIFRDDDNSGGFTAGDAVGAGLTVRLRADTGQAGAVIATTSTNATGQFTFNLLAPGTYWVELENPTTISYGASGALRKVTVTPQGTISVPGIFTGSLVSTIAEATAKAIGSAVAVVGNVTVAGGQITSSNGSISEIWIQDATGGIAVFPVPSADSALYRLGQRVTVSGTRQANGQAAQIGNTTNVPVLTQQAGGTVVAPVAQTGAQVIARAAEGRLITLSGFKVTTIGTASATTGAFTVTGTTPDGQSVQVRVTGPVTLTIGGTPTTIRNNGIARTDFVVGNTYTITGIETQFNGTSQIKTRQPSDVVAAPVATPSRVIINEFMANPATTTDPAGEYIELYNAGGTAQDLTGWRLLDINGTTGVINGADTIGTSSATPTPLVIQPGEYMLLVHNSTVTTSGPLAVAKYKYAANIQLNNSGTQPLVLKDAAGVTVDSIAYVSPTGVTAGVARGVVNPALENSDANVNWVDQTTVFVTIGTNSDKGTPGARNDGAAAPPSAIIGATAAPSAVRAATTRPRGVTSSRR